jgi:hypothetical protein
MQQWLADGAAHEAAWERTARASARLDALEPVSRFREAIAGSEDADRIAAALHDLFDTPDWAVSLVGDWIAQARRDPFFMPPFRAVSGPFHQGALLIECAGARVALSIIDPVALAAHKREGGGKGSVHFTGRRTFLKFLDGGGMRLGFWQAPEANEDVARLRAIPCERIGERTVETGVFLAVDTRRTSYIIESAACPAVFLHGEVRIESAVLAREYDAVSRRLIGVSSAGGHWSRIQMMLSWLCRQGDPRAGAALAEAVRDTPFFVRWHAMREWLALDPASAMPVLERMACSDPHDEVRRAAQQALALFADRQAA